MAREFFNVMPYLVLKILLFPFYRHCGSERLDYLPKKVHFSWWQGQDSAPRVALLCYKVAFPQSCEGGRKEG